jgi:hypothetical protein
MALSASSGKPPPKPLSGQEAMLAPVARHREEIEVMAKSLAYTKPKPLQRQSITTAGPEDWLRAAIAAGSAGGNDA